MAEDGARLDRGIRPATWEWPDRSKWWLFANGVTLNQTDGTLVVPRNMEEVACDLDTAIDEAKQGKFQPQRENDELTRALKNPEHPGRARSIGVVHGKLLGPKIAHTILIKRARQKRMRKSVPHKKR